MKFGFIVPNILSPLSGDRSSLRAAAILAEDVGFDSLWVSDHILMPREHAQYGSGTEMLMTLAYLGGITRRVALGTSVLVLPMRNPLVAARQIASLAHLTGRETIVGVGVGWCAEEYGFLKADFHRRGALADEYIGIMRKLWSEENPSHEGTYAFSDVIFAPKPRPLPPIWIGGSSDAALRRAVTLGDGWQPTGRTEPDDLARSVGKLREWNTAGRDITISLSTRLDMREGAPAVIDRLSRFQEAGLQYPAVRLWHETLADLVTQLEAFGRDVLPAFA